MMKTDTYRTVGHDSLHVDPMPRRAIGSRRTQTSGGQYASGSAGLHGADRRGCVSETPDFQRWLHTAVSTGRVGRRRAASTASGNPFAKVYYFQRLDGAIKIGTSKNLADRIRHLRANPGGKLLATESGWYAEEAWRHFQFRSTALGGEWFEPSQPLLALVASLEVAA